MTYILFVSVSQHGYFSVMLKCWYQDIWLALLGQWVRHQNTNLQISIWIKRDLCLLLLHKYIKNIYHTHTRISYLFLKITSLRLFGKKFSQNCGRTLMFLCLCLLQIMDSRCPPGSCQSPPPVREAWCSRWQPPPPSPAHPAEDWPPPTWGPGPSTTAVIPSTCPPTPPQGWVTVVV